MEWALIARILAESTDHVLLFGPPGVGKTAAAVRAFRERGSLVFSVTVTDDMAAAELIGHFIVGQGGSYTWHDGPAVRAWRTGAGLVINELELASGPVTTALHAILDDPAVAQLTLASGETVTPAPGFRAIATSNAHPADLTPALLDRLTLRLHVREPHPEALRALAPADREFLLRAYQAPRPALTYREYRSFLDLLPVYGERAAAEAVFGERGDEIVTARRLGARKR
jgi:MoxR-like ATPase